MGSLAIFACLVDRYAPSLLVVKSDKADYARCLEGLHFGEATMSMSINLMLAQLALPAEKHRHPAMAQWALNMVSDYFDRLRATDSWSRATAD